ncbi:MAG TPA: flavodoxin domain-containing protein [Actinocrinis sp.]|nr:flavodoxin domain-containing protein [Actinocrinis sp.]
MKVLVCAASKHGATAQIGEAIADALNENGIHAALRAPQQIADLQGYDALVLGSGVYMGRWLPDARRLVERISGQLNGRPVWLFSSGPIGDPARQNSRPPVNASAIIAATAAREHRVFSGRMERAQLGIVHRAIMSAMHIADGDDRDWAEIAAWGKQIAEQLRSSSSTSTQSESEPGGVR